MRRYRLLACKNGIVVICNNDPYITYIVATDAQKYSAKRRQAKLLNCLGSKGQRICDSLPAPVGPAQAMPPAEDGQ